MSKEYKKGKKRQNGEILRQRYLSIAHAVLVAGRSVSFFECFLAIGLARACRARLPTRILSEPELVVVFNPVEGQLCTVSAF